MSSRKRNKTKLPKNSEYQGRESSGGTWWKSIVPAIIIAAGSIIGVWIQKENKIHRLEAEIENLKNNIVQTQNEANDLSNQNASLKKQIEPLQILANNLYEKNESDALSRLYLEIASYLTTRKSRSSPPSQKAYFIAFVRNNSTKEPVEGAEITLSADGGIMLSGRSKSNGAVYLELPFSGLDRRIEYRIDKHGFKLSSNVITTLRNPIDIFLEPEKK